MPTAYRPGSPRTHLSRRGSLVVFDLGFTADPADVPQEPHAFSLWLIWPMADAFSLPCPNQRTTSTSTMWRTPKSMPSRCPPTSPAASVRREAGGCLGAAGSLLPCPASISVMLLALSVGITTSGLVLVFGFSLGLAVALVDVGLVVVAGLSQLDKSGHFSAISRHAQRFRLASLWPQVSQPS